MARQIACALHVQPQIRQHTSSGLFGFLIKIRPHIEHRLLKIWPNSISHNCNRRLNELARQSDFFAHQKTSAMIDSRNASSFSIQDSLNSLSICDAILNALAIAINVCDPALIRISDVASTT